MKDLVDRTTDKHRQLELAYQTAYWTAMNSGREEDFERSAALELAFSRFYSDPRGFAEVKAAEASGKASDPVLLRQLKLLHDQYAANQVEPRLLRQMIEKAAAVEQRFHTFRGKVDGKQLSANDLRAILEKEPNPELRRKAWEAFKGVGPVVAPLVIELVELRNQAARAQGFASFYQWRLTTSELEPAFVAATFDQIGRRSDAAYAALKAEIDGRLAQRWKLRPADLRPWDYEDPFFQAAPAVAALDIKDVYRGKDPLKLAVSFYGGIGLAVEDILGCSDLYERKGKVEHAFCFNLDRRSDIRVLANLRPDERWTGTLLHELGHAVYEKYFDPTLPYLLRQPAHPFTTEGVAELMGLSTTDRRFLAEMAAVPVAELDAVAAAAAVTERTEAIVFARWSLVMVDFERELYQNPRQDLQRRWWEVVQRYQGLAMPPGREQAADWATKIHFVSSPVYYHNYMLGRLFAAQLRQHLARQVLVQGGVPASSIVGHTLAGDYLRTHVFAEGARLRWDELVRRATGAPLGVDGFAAEYLGTAGAGRQGV